MDRLLATDRAEFASVPCVSARVASSPAPAAIGDAGFSVPALKGCRVCLDLRYASQNMGEVDRVWRQIGKITRRVDPATTILSRDEFPEKPKRMRWRTYQRLMYRHAAQVNRLFDVAVHAVQTRMTWRKVPSLRGARRAASESPAQACVSLICHVDWS